MTFNARWTPGPQAVAGMHTVGLGIHQVGLVVYLDPDSLAILPPPNPDHWPAFVRLLRQLSDGALELADFLDTARKGGEHRGSTTRLLRGQPREHG